MQTAATRLEQHLKALKAQIRNQLEQALQNQEPRIRELLQTGQELTLNLQLEVVPKARTS